jgi:hypothetical protein
LFSFLLLEKTWEKKLKRIQIRSSTEISHH